MYRLHTCVLIGEQSVQRCTCDGVMLNACATASNSIASTSNSICLVSMIPVSAQSETVAATSHKHLASPLLNHSWIWHLHLSAVVFLKQRTRWDGTVSSIPLAALPVEKRARVRTRSCLSLVMRTYLAFVLHIATNIKCILQVLTLLPWNTSRWRDGLLHEASHSSPVRLRVFNAAQIGAETMHICHVRSSYQLCCSSSGSNDNRSEPYLRHHCSAIKSIQRAKPMG